MCEFLCKVFAVWYNKSTINDSTLLFQGLQEGCTTHIWTEETLENARFDLIL
jgi:hypothetical protein